LIEEKGTYQFADIKVNCNVYEFSDQDTNSTAKGELEGFAMYAKEVGWCYTEYEFNENGDKYIHELTETLTLEEFEALKSKAYNDQVKN